MSPTLLRRARALLTALLVVVAVALPTAVAGPAAADQPPRWNFALARVAGAQPLGAYGRGVVIAVVDTWVDAAHPQLEGRVLPGADCGSGTCTPGPAAPDGCEAHGTHVAGTLASRDYGVAPQATLLPVRVLRFQTSSTGQGVCAATPAAVAAGITWAAGHGAPVVNLSLGGGDGYNLLVPQSSAITDAVAAAAAQGVVVVFAAGNASTTTRDDYGDNALLVAAVGPSGGLAGYSDRGGATAVAAPGGDSGPDASTPCDSASCVLSTWYCTDPGPPSPAPGCTGHVLANAEGTSMAAPHVAGTAALLIAQDPTRGRADVLASIERTARPLAGTAHGLVDAEAALRLRGAPTAPAPQAAAAPVVRRGFAGCPRMLAVTRDSRPLVRCRTTPAAGGVVVTEQQQRGTSWVTVGRVRTGRDGAFRALGPRLSTSSRLRLLVGRTTFTLAVHVR